MQVPKKISRYTVAICTLDYTDSISYLNGDWPTIDIAVMIQDTIKLINTSNDGTALDSGLCDD